jgi:hypothetical protein
MLRRVSFALRVVVLAAVAGGLGCAAGQTKRAVQRPTEAPDEDFVGKVVFVQTDRETVTLEKARVRHAGGRPFVVGKVLDDETVTRPQFVGLTQWLPLSDVRRIVVSEDLEQFRKSVKPRPAK